MNVSSTYKAFDLWENTAIQKTNYKKQQILLRAWLFGLLFFVFSGLVLSKDPVHDRAVRNENLKRYSSIRQIKLF